MRCMRLGGSIAGTCEIGLTELTEDHGARVIAELQGGILPCLRSRKYGGEYPDLDAPRAGKSAVG
jgi:hypothetical protein